MDREHIYAIGDLQGCRESLDLLLEDIPETAPLIFVGDLVNRGPESLATLRRVISLGNRAKCVLGNHDLHLLAVAAGAKKASRKDTITDILNAPDAAELIDWIRQQPLLLEQAGILFVHAGIHPLWSLDKARALATEAQQILSGDNWHDILQHMYGNLNWDEKLQGAERLQAILNVFTRMRFVDRKTGQLDFKQKEDIGSAPKSLVPWFKFDRRILKDQPICFGHWSMLGLVNTPTVIAIDTGCLWGGELTAVRFPDRKIFQEKCPCWADPFAFK